MSAGAPRAVLAARDPEMPVLPPTSTGNSLRGLGHDDHGCDAARTEHRPPRVGPARILASRSNGRGGGLRHLRVEPRPPRRRTRRPRFDTPPTSPPSNDRSTSSSNAISNSVARLDPRLARTVRWAVPDPPPHRHRRIPPLALPPPTTCLCHGAHHPAHRNADLARHLRPLPDGTAADRRDRNLRHRLRRALQPQPRTRQQRVQPVCRDAEHALRLCAHRRSQSGV